MRVSLLCFIALEGECNASEVEGDRVPLSTKAKRCKLVFYGKSNLLNSVFFIKKKSSFVNSEFADVAIVGQISKIFGA